MPGMISETVCLCLVTTNQHVYAFFNNVELINLNIVNTIAAAPIYFSLVCSAVLQVLRRANAFPIV